MSFADRFVDLAIATLFEFLTLKDIKILLSVDKKLKRLLQRHRTKLYISKSFIRDKKLQEEGINVGSSVNCVAWNHDGTRIVSGSCDGTIRQWDTETGKSIENLLGGNTGYVLSVAYNPDGKCIVSGNSDWTVRQFDAETCKQIGKPLGHTNWVISVAYSPDGRRIVSGSAQGHIHQWNAETGEPIGEPLWGHTNWVNSVAYSPDGKRIVSGSDDCTIRQWNAVSDETVLSSDNTVTGKPWQLVNRLIPKVSEPSVSRKRITVRDLKQIGEPWQFSEPEVLKPLRGHTDRVWRVSYSPDGKRIVSGSVDNTIRQWNAETGEQIGEPMKGHTDWVRSVAYSPDDNQGLRIVSGSVDRTIRQWNADTGKPIGEPLIHTGMVHSVAYSPDGTRIVSGSHDGTIRIWKIK